MSLIKLLAVPDQPSLHCFFLCFGVTKVLVFRVFCSQSSCIISQLPGDSALLVQPRWAQAELDLACALSPGLVKLRDRRGLVSSSLHRPTPISGMCLLVGSLDLGMEFPSG